jgi:tetratricopeptide (TPR) repeat protein
MSKNTEKTSKTSSADYPVDPVERSNQEARLKKAAAAGASVSKSPIPGLMLQARATVAPAQPAAEPQTSLTNPVASIEPAPQMSNASAVSPVTNDEVLVELRKISAWAEQQRKLARWSFIFVAVFVPVLIAVFIMMDRHWETTLESNTAPQQSDWYDVDRNVRSGDFQKATSIGEELIAKTPQSPEAHQRLARAYLACGDVEKAKEHFAEAFRLFPSEENEKLLAAIDKRIGAEKP